MRIGHGYDVHRLVKDRKLIIGGVDIPFERGLFGHSDADVLIHAIIDALLGAACMGDIGAIFPDSDPKFLGADSLVLLKEVIKQINILKYKISNIDSTIVSQAPKLSPYIDQMRENISRVCSIKKSQINIKATTEEGLGFTGTSQGIAAHAVVCLEE
jgi:2-C-methyl-D-erythritol 2,4-cyclodiphosphate synthase